jgi:hypothetical protein
MTISNLNAISKAMNSAFKSMKKSCRGPKHVKLLTETQFKQKVEAHVWQINNAITALYNEVNKLGVTAEDQLTACDNSEDETVRHMYQWNGAEEVQEWVQAVEETIDGIDTGSVLAKLRKANAKKHKKRNKNAA